MPHGAETVLSRCHVARVLGASSSHLEGAVQDICRVDLTCGVVTSDELVALRDNQLVLSNIYYIICKASRVGFLYLAFGCVR